MFRGVFKRLGAAWPGVAAAAVGQAEEVDPNLIRGSLGVALDSATLSATGANDPAGVLDETLGDTTVAATGSATFGTTFTVPAGFYDDDDAILRSTGRMGGLLTLHYIQLGTTHYVWFRQGDAAPDPGDYVAALSGLTGIEVSLGTSHQTRAQVATAIASAVTTFGGGLSATSSSDEVTVNGVTSHAFGSTGPAAAGAAGILGTPDDRVLSLNSFATASFRVALLDPADLPSNTFIVTGVDVAVGDTHAAGLVIALYQGGVSDSDPNGATLLGHVGTTAGDGSTFVWDRVFSSGVEVDPSAGRVWVSLMHDAGDFEMSFTWAAQGSSEGNNYIVAGGNVMRLITGGPSSSDSADLPASVGSVSSSEIGMPAIRLGFVETPFQTDCEQVFNIGTLAGLAAGVRDDSFTFSSTSGDELVVGNSFSVPAGWEGVELYEMSINYATHNSGSDYRALFAVGGTADDNLSGATFYDVGQTSGTATGWNDVAAPAGIPLAASTRIWLAIKFDAVGGSEISFDANASNEYEDEHWGTAYLFNGNTTESEFAPLSNPIVSSGEETTNVDYDPSLADPAPGAWTPNGLNFTNDNNVGVAGRARVTRRAA